MSLIWAPKREELSKVNNILGQGAFGVVYALDDNHVAKVLKVGDLSDLVGELSMLQKAYNANVNVPTPYGIENVKINDFFQEKEVPALIMERIYGERVIDVLRSDRPYKAQVKKLYAEEISKCNHAKIRIWDNDHEYENAIYDADKEKVYLIDFGVREYLPETTGFFHALRHGTFMMRNLH